MKDHGGFTLFEIVIAVFILILLLGMAVPSLSGVLADKRLRRSLDHFNSLVRRAHERSLAEHRAYLIVWGDHEISLRPDVFLKTEAHVPIDSVPVSKADKWQVEFPAALTKKPLPGWVFCESGVSEPLRITFAGHDGPWTSENSPLNQVPEIVAHAPP